MPERHTIDFVRVSFNILSDAERGVVTLQFDRIESNAKATKQLLKAIDGRFGVGVRGRVNRWRMGNRHSLRLISRDVPHPKNPDVIRCELAVSPGEPLDPALAVLIDFFRRQPGYRRTFGAPLDRDEWEPRPAKFRGDLSGSALSVLKRLLAHRSRKPPGAVDAE